MFMINYKCFLNGIITTDEIMNRQKFKEANLKLLNKVTKENYLWAQRNCNSKKASMVLIKLSSNNIFVTDKDRNC